MNRKYILIIVTIAVISFFYIRKKKELNLSADASETNGGSGAGYSFRVVPPKTSNFNLSEFQSKDGKKVPLAMYGGLQLLMEQLEVIRAYFGNSPITIISGYRSPKHNEAVGGTGNSMHLQALAADISVSGRTPKEVQQGISVLMTSRKIRPGGLGQYDTFTHYDIGRYRSW